MRSLASSVFLATILARVYAVAIGPSASLNVTNKVVAPDGYSRVATVVNGISPGPIIKGNKGDTFSLNVFNNLDDSSLDLETSIHWHGILQRATNGSAFINQHPITPGESFLCQFNAGEQAGTYWYHSYYKTQFSDGLRGAFVIYDPDDPHLGLYDIDNEDTIITLMDWHHFTSTEAPLVPVYNSALINGIGRYNGGPDVPLAVVNVVQHLRYRLRLVSLSCEPAYDFSIDGHELTVIEVEGTNVQPLVVDSLQIFAGQRYSVVLEANQPVDNYGIRASPNTGIKPNDNFTNLAILRYSGAPDQQPSNDPPINARRDVNTPVSLQSLKETQLHPLVPTPVPGRPVPGGADININLNVTLSSDFTEFLINGLTFDAPTVPVLSQLLRRAQSTSDRRPRRGLDGLEGKKSVEIRITGGSADGPHSLHLHGHKFHVVRSAGSDTYNYVDPVIRDVVSIGDTGDNVTIRFFTDNPGT